MGRTERGVDFLRYHFVQTGTIIGKKTVNNFMQKDLRLYEQEPPRTRKKRLREYVKREVEGRASVPPWLTLDLVLRSRPRNRR